MYELRARRLRTRLLAAFWPNRAFGMLTLVAVILMVGPGGWVGLGAVAYLVLVLWRGFGVKLRADASGITVRNVLRTRKLSWSQIRAIRSPREADLDPSTLDIEAEGGFLRRVWSSMSVHVTLGIGKDRRREIALELATLGRTHGHGIPTGTEDDIVELFKAGLFHNRDPEAHNAWWKARSDTRS